jgi:predicted nucleic acid-binding protein
MNVVDSSGWLEYFADTANANFFAAAIENTAELIVPVITIYEVFKRILQQRSEDEALLAVATMSQGIVVDMDASIAMVAARLSHDHKLPMADGVILATARANDALLWTQDEHFEGLEGVRYRRKS